MPAITVEQFNGLARTALLLVKMLGLRLESLSDDKLLMRAVYDDDFLRPGGTVTGPVMINIESNERREAGTTTGTWW